MVKLLLTYSIRNFGLTHKAGQPELSAAWGVNMQRTILLHGIRRMCRSRRASRHADAAMSSAVCAWSWSEAQQRLPVIVEVYFFAGCAPLIC